MARWVSGRGLLALQAPHDSPCVIQGPPPSTHPAGSSCDPDNPAAGWVLMSLWAPGCSLWTPDRGYKYQVGSCSLKHRAGCAKSPQVARLRDPCAGEMAAAFGKGTESLLWAFEGSTPSARSLLPTSSFAALEVPGIRIPRVRSVLGSDGESQDAAQAVARLFPPSQNAQGASMPAPGAAPSCSTFPAHLATPSRCC